MPELVIPDVEEGMLQSLQVRASSHGRSPEAEARWILQQALETKNQTAWTKINDFRKGLAKSGRSFSDSTDFIREDRGR